MEIFPFKYLYEMAINVMVTNNYKWVKSVLRTSMKLKYIQDSLCYNKLINIDFKPSGERDQGKYLKTAQRNFYSFMKWM